MSFVNLIQQPGKKTSPLGSHSFFAAEHGSAANQQPIKASRVTCFALGCALLLALVGVSAPTQAATITVTGSGDAIAVDGLVTLREAITSANNNANVNADVVAVGAYGTDTINFAIAGAGVHTISPTSALPTVTDTVVINGYSQPGSSANTLAVGDNAVLRIEINGTNAPGGAFIVNSAGNTFTGLVINRFFNASFNPGYAFRLIGAGREKSEVDILERILAQHFDRDRLAFEFYAFTCRAGRRKRAQRADRKIALLEDLQDGLTDSAGGAYNRDSNSISHCSILQFYFRLVT